MSLKEKLEIIKTNTDELKKVTETNHLETAVKRVKAGYNGDVGKNPDANGIQVLESTNKLNELKQDEIDDQELALIYNTDFKALQENEAINKNSFLYFPELISLKNPIEEKSVAKFTAVEDHAKEAYWIECNFSKEEVNIKVYENGIFRGISSEFIYKSKDGINYSKIIGSNKSVYFRIEEDLKAETWNENCSEFIKLAIGNFDGIKQAFMSSRSNEIKYISKIDFKDKNHEYKSKFIDIKYNDEMNIFYKIKSLVDENKLSTIVNGFSTIVRNEETNKIIGLKLYEGINKITYKDNKYYLTSEKNEEISVYHINLDEESELIGEITLDSNQQLDLLSINETNNIYYLKESNTIFNLLKDYIYFNTENIYCTVSVEYYNENNELEIMQIYPYQFGTIWLGAYLNQLTASNVCQLSPEITAYSNGGKITGNAQGNHAKYNNGETLKSYFDLEEQGKIDRTMMYGKPNQDPIWKSGDVAFDVNFRNQYKPFGVKIHESFESRDKLPASSRSQLTKLDKLDDDLYIINNDSIREIVYKNNIPEEDYFTDIDAWDVTEDGLFYFSYMYHEASTGKEYLCVARQNKIIKETVNNLEIFRFDTEGQLKTGNDYFFAMYNKCFFYEDCKGEDVNLVKVSFERHDIGYTLEDDPDNEGEQIQVPIEGFVAEKDTFTSEIVFTGKNKLDFRNFTFFSSRGIIYNRLSKEENKIYMSVIKSDGTVEVCDKDIILEEMFPEETYTWDDIKIIENNFQDYWRAYAFYIFELPILKQKAPEFEEDEINNLPESENNLSVTIEIDELKEGNRIKDYEKIIYAFNPSDNSLYFKKKLTKDEYSYTFNLSRDIKKIKLYIDCSESNFYDDLIYKTYDTSTEDESLMIKYYERPYYQYYKSFFLCVGTDLKMKKSKIGCHNHIGDYHIRYYLDNPDSQGLSELAKNYDNKELRDSFYSSYVDFFSNEVSKEHPYYWINKIWREAFSTKRCRINKSTLVGNFLYGGKYDADIMYGASNTFYTDVYGRTDIINENSFRNNKEGILKYPEVMITFCYANDDFQIVFMRRNLTRGETFTGYCDSASDYYHARGNNTFHGYTKLTNGDKSWIYVGSRNSYIGGIQFNEDLDGKITLGFKYGSYDRGTDMIFYNKMCLEGNKPFNFNPEFCVTFYKNDWGSVFAKDGYRRTIYNKFTDNIDSEFLIFRQLPAEAKDAFDHDVDYTILPASQPSVFTNQGSWVNKYVTLYKKEEN